MNNEELTQANVNKLIKTIIVNFLSSNTPDQQKAIINLVYIQAYHGANPTFIKAKEYQANGVATASDLMMVVPKIAEYIKDMPNGKELIKKWCTDGTILPEFKLIIPTALRDHNHKFIRIAKGAKIPVDKNWGEDPSKQFTAEEIEEWIENGNDGYGGNAGLIMNTESTLCCIDADNLKMLTPLINSLGRDTLIIKSGKGEHYYYNIKDYDEPQEKVKKIIFYSDDPTEVNENGGPSEYGDFRPPGAKCQQLMTGSLHPNGSFYTTINNAPLKTITYIGLKNAILNLKKYGVITTKPKKNRSADTTSTSPTINTKTKKAIKKIHKHEPRMDEILIPITAQDGTTPYIDSKGNIVGANPITGGKDGVNFAVNADCWCDYHTNTGGYDKIKALAAVHGIISLSEASDDLPRKEWNQIYKKVLPFIERDHPRWYKEIQDAREEERKAWLEGRKQEWDDCEKMSRKKALINQPDDMVGAEGGVCSAEGGSDENQKTSINDNLLLDDEEIVLTPEEQTEAHTIYDSGEFINYILKSCKRDHAGDEHIIRALTMMHALHYIINSNGLHIQIQANPGAGKSHGVDTWRKRTTRALKRDFSPKALWYTSASNSNTTIQLDDIILNDDLESIIKQATTDWNARPIREITETRTNNNPRGNKQGLPTLPPADDDKTIIQSAPARLCFVFVNADLIGDDQIHSRTITLFSDTSIEQKQAIRATQYAKCDIIQRPLIDNTQKICKWIWNNLIPPAQVSVPATLTDRIVEADYIQEDTRNRDIYLELIKASCILNSHNRQCEYITNDEGIQIPTYIATEEDFYIMADLMNPLLQGIGGSQTCKLPKNAQRIVDFLKKKHAEDASELFVHEFLATDIYIKEVPMSRSRWNEAIHGIDRQNKHATGLLDMGIGLDIVTKTERTADSNYTTNKTYLKVKWDVFLSWCGKDSNIKPLTLKD